jgi:hypothetical protein
MPHIRTTTSITDRASQSFLFSQFNFSFGVLMHPPRKK